MDRSGLLKRQLLSIVIPLALVAILPLLMWAIKNNRFEIRKKAASGEIPVNNKVVWNTEYASLAANNFYIKAGNDYYSGVGTNLQLHSNPPTNPNYMTLEATWKEFSPKANQEVEMRMFIYFKSDGVYWWSDEIRTYDGNAQGEWIYYKPANTAKPFFKTLVGRPFFQQGDLYITSTPLNQGTIYMHNPRIMPFFRAYCFNASTTVDLRNGNLQTANISYTSDVAATGSIGVEAAKTPEFVKTAYNNWVVAGKPVLPGCTPCRPYPIISCTNGKVCAQVETVLPSDGYYCPIVPTVRPITPVVTGTTCGADGARCTLPGCQPCPSGVMCAAVCRTQYGVCKAGRCVNESVCIPPLPTCAPGKICPEYEMAAGVSFCTPTPTPRITPRCIPPQPTCTGKVCPMYEYQTVAGIPYCTPIPTKRIIPTPTPPYPASCTGKANNAPCSTQICRESFNSTFGGTGVCSWVPGHCVNGQCIGGPTPTVTPSLNPIPNCSNLSGTTTFKVGETATYNVDFTSAQGNLSGEVFYDPGNKTINSIGKTSLLGTSGHAQFTWKPLIGGTYQVCCRAWNDGIAECRPHAYVDGPPRYDCTGSDAKCLSVIVNPGPSITPSITPSPATHAQKLEFSFKFAGVTGDKATGAKVALRIITPTTDTAIQNPIAATYVGNDVYKIAVQIPQNLSVGGLYKFVLKGEKHLARKICMQVGQTGICRDTDWFRPSTDALTLGFDITGVPLEPGDTYPQDGKVDSADMDRLFALLGKTSSSLTDQDKLVGDLDYNGVVNALDVYLLRKTLETRYDEN